jgi:hypothetical protein
MQLRVGRSRVNEDTCRLCKYLFHKSLWFMETNANQIGRVDRSPQPQTLSFGRTVTATIGSIDLAV